MRRIEFYKSIFTPKETNTLGNQVSKALNVENYTDVNLLRGKTELEETNGKFTQILNTSLANPYTKQLSDDNIWRDTVFDGGLLHAKSYTYWIFDTEKREAAEKVSEVFKRHEVDLHSRNFQKKSSAVSSLIKDLNTAEMQTYLTTLGMIFYGLVN